MQLLAIGSGDRNRLELAPDLLRHALGFVEAGPVKDGEEFLPAETRDEVAGTQPPRLVWT